MAWQYNSLYACLSLLTVWTAGRASPCNNSISSSSMACANPQQYHRAYALSNAHSCSQVTALRAAAILPASGRKSARVYAPPARARLSRRHIREKYLAYRAAVCNTRLSILYPSRTLALHNAN